MLFMNSVLDVLDSRMQEVCVLAPSWNHTLPLLSTNRQVKCESLSRTCRSAPNFSFSHLLIRPLIRPSYLRFTPIFHSSWSLSLPCSLLFALSILLCCARSLHRSTHLSLILSTWIPDTLLFSMTSLRSLALPFDSFHCSDSL